MDMAEKQKLFSTTLGGVVDFQNGGAWKEDEYVVSGVPVTRVTNCQSGTVDLSGCKYLSFASAKRYEKHQLVEGDLIVATVGSHPNQPGSVVGRTSVVPKSASGSLLNQNAVRLRAKAGLLDQRYLTYLASSKEFRDYIIAHARGAASQVRMSIELLKEMPLQLPPLSIQQTVASFLDAYDKLIENNIRRIEIFEEMARRLYEEWFCELQFPGCEVAVKDWSIVPFGSVLKFNIGGGWGKDEVDNEHTHPGYVIRGTDIPSAKRLDVLRCPYRYHKSSNIRSRRLDVGDIVMEVSGGSHDQSVGRTLYVSKELLQVLGEDVLCASFCKRLVVDDSVVNPLFAYYHLDHAYRSGRLDQFQVQSTGIKNFQFTPFLEKHEISIPPASLQEKFGSAAAPLLALHQALSKKSVNLRAQRDLLLPKLISGEIDVSDIPMPT